MTSRILEWERERWVEQVASAVSLCLKQFADPQFMGRGWPTAEIFPFSPSRLDDSLDEKSQDLHRQRLAELKPIVISVNMLTWATDPENCYKRVVLDIVKRLMEDEGWKQEMLQITLRQDEAYREFVVTPRR